MNSRYLGLALTLSVAFAVVACSDNDDKNPVGVSGSKGGSKAAGCNFTLNSKTWEFSQVLPGSGSTIPATYKYTFGSGSTPMTPPPRPPATTSKPSRPTRTPT